MRFGYHTVAETSRTSESTFDGGPARLRALIDIPGRTVVKYAGDMAGRLYGTNPPNPRKLLP